MRQRLRSSLTYANVMVTILAFIVLGGGTALAAYVVSSNSQIGPGTVSGHKPPTGKHSNLIAGSVNGQDLADNSLGGTDINESSLTGDTRTLIYNAASSNSPPTTIATVGPYAIKGRCASAGASLYVNGPTGAADVMVGQTRNDATDLGTASSGLLIPANTDTFIIGSGIPLSGNYLRIAGTAMLRTSTGTLVQVDFNAVGDDRGSGSCFIYGTATRAT